MYATIEHYLDALNIELRHDDPVLRQDALTGTRAHLSMALEAAREKTPDISVLDALRSIVAHHGAPQEIASAYGKLHGRYARALLIGYGIQP